LLKQKVHHAWVPQSECFTKIAPYPFGMKNVADAWTQEQRARQAELLAEALVRERVAVDQLKQALKRIDPGN